jgi:enoyl-CoA hydratase/carnithine racemase
VSAAGTAGLVRSEARDGGVAVITLDRPRANAINPALVADLRRAVADAADAPALVLTSSQSLFSAGWDLPTVRGFGREEMSGFLADFTALMRDMFSFEGPMVAALPGHAIAGGMILASAADERIAADGKGEFGLSEVVLGVPIPRAAYEIFRYALGERGAERLAAAGDNVPADRALEMGFLDRIVPAADLLDAAVERARELAGRSRAAYVEIKRRARAEWLERFDRASEGDPFLDFWFSEEARQRIDGLVARLTRKS